ncbi:MAG: DUF411 domain-containing protein [Candidatus Harrisonbacteria bacterium]|nr:DUF411 domain-containing protein [Candidatus Harrisonbacteria bacterium]
MKNTFIVGALGAFVLLVALAFVFGSDRSGPEENQKLSGGQEKIEVVMYKSPTCGCCGAYLSYLKAQNYSVELREQNDLTDIKEQFGIPQDLLSCHTMLIGGYTIEGHVPEAAILKLLEEKPDIDGIALPGMPSGSPGMPGLMSDPLVIYSFKGGTVAEFMTL